MADRAADRLEPPSFLSQISPIYDDLHKKFPARKE
jgi:hypothetical protein